MEGKFVRERKESGLEEGKVHTRLTLAKVTDGDGWMALGHCTGKKEPGEDWSPISKPARTNATLDT